MSAIRSTNMDPERCSLARTVSVIGDRWTLLVLRECFFGVNRFEDFQRQMGVSRALLIDRLRKLVDEGVLRKALYQDLPPRYEYLLTEKGLDLHPIMMAMVHWGDVHLADASGRPVLQEHVVCGHFFDPVTVCSKCNLPIKPSDVKAHRNPGWHDNCDGEK